MNTLDKLDNAVGKNFYGIFLFLIAILFVILMLNMNSTMTANAVLNQRVLEVKELNKPVNLELFAISCEGCFSVELLTSTIKSQNVELIGENILDQDSTEARALIDKYGITKLPSVLISGEIDSDKINFNNFILVDDMLILEDVKAPYVDLTTGELLGQVTVIEIIDSSCEECIQSQEILSSIPLTFAQGGVEITDWQKHEYDSPEAKQLISKFGIKKIPALLISNDINVYENERLFLEQSDTEEKQGFYAMHSLVPPFRDVATNKIVGLVDLVMITDESCADCYNVEQNLQILAGLGLKLNTQETYDISSSEGQKFVSKYNIKSVPMIILSSDANLYESFVNAWQQVGSEESDGWFIMRTPEVLGVVSAL